jgi:tetratricopeptide (TPR) repeat protein
VGHADAHVEAALSAVFGILEGVRARRYPAARRALTELRDTLAGGAAPELALVRRHADPDVLQAALVALDLRTAQDAADEAALADQLAPALAAPLTRAEALNTLGVRAATLGDTARAQRLFMEAIAADPGHYRALTNIGNMKLEAGDAVGAEAEYRAALKLAPEYDGAHHNLGVALRRQGRVAEAVSAIRRGQRLGMRRSKEDTEAEMREQFAGSATLRRVRIAVLVVVAVLVLLALRGALH